MRWKMNTSIVGTIMDIKRFAVHDGPGIRTTFFLKGCSLRCIWCHNPEGISRGGQLAYYPHKCIHCGMCARVCPNRAHSLDKNGHVFDRYFCNGCGACEDVCLGNALKFCFFLWRAKRNELILVVLKERNKHLNLSSERSCCLSEY